MKTKKYMIGIMTIVTIISLIIPTINAEIGEEDNETNQANPSSGDSCLSLLLEYLDLLRQLDYLEENADDFEDEEYEEWYDYLTDEIVKVVLLAHVKGCLWIYFFDDIDVGPISAENNYLPMTNEEVQVLNNVLGISVESSSIYQSTCPLCSQ